MVVENLFKPELVMKQPLFALYLGVCLSILGTSIGLFIFPEDASLAGILFTTIAATPYLVKVTDVTEDRQDMTALGNFFWRNRKIAGVYFYFFLGVTVGYLLWLFVLPSASAHFFFAKQYKILSAPVASGAMGFFSQAQKQAFVMILSNNMKLTLLCILLSLIYGSGAVLLLTWNASVLGVFVYSLRNIGTFIPFIPHTVLEFIAYFFAAMAGGLISIAFDKGGYGSDKFNKALFDGCLLFILAVVIIFMAALVETFGFF